MTDDSERSKRNEVFAAEAVKLARATGALPPEAADEFGFSVPVERVPLASNGLVYPEGHPYHGREFVEIRPMAARDEDILTSRALVLNGTVISRLIGACLIDKAVNTRDLIAGDRNAIMIAIRATGYGKDYDTEVVCPDCDEKQEFTFDLSQLPIKRLKLEPMQPGQNLFAFTLPKSKANIVWRFLTGSDEEDQTQEAKAKKKAAFQQESNITSKLQRMIVSINGVTDKSKLSRAIPHMPAYDTKEFRNYVEAYEPGIEMEERFSCKYCGHVGDIAVPLGVNFFWPTAKKS